MTMIRYYPSEYELLMQGHAGTAPVGHDLVCCACSTLGYTLLQALDDRGIDYSIREDAELHCYTSSQSLSTVSVRYVR